jgi:hypothetical protein
MFKSLSPSSSHLSGRHRRAPLRVEELEGRILPSVSDVFLGPAYRDLFGRASTISERAGWAYMLDSGVSRQQVALGLTACDEYRTERIEQAYSAFLHRSADSAGRAGFLDLLRHGGSDEQMEVLILTSTEYAQQHTDGSVSGFVTALYHDVLHRSPDAHELAGWVGFLNGLSASRDVVARGFVTSPEAYTDQVAEFYQHFLHRQAGSGEGDGFVADRLAGMSEEQVISLILASQEYLDLHLLRSHQPPILVLTSPANGSRTGSNVTVEGQASADETGLAVVYLSLDGVTLAVLPTDAAGHFQYTTHLALDGTADGSHSVRVTAIDDAGRIANDSESFTLDTNLVNHAVTTNTGVQQMPSVAVDPYDSRHIVIAYLDYSLLTTGYAGIGVAVSHDNGTTWQHSSVPLSAGFDQGAARPNVHFDAQGRVLVSFAAATFLGHTPALTDPNGGAQRALGFQSNNGVFVARSDTGGLTWNAPVAVASNLYDGQHPVPFEIKPDLAIDTYLTLPNGRPNPNYGNLYEVWSRYYPAGQFPGQPDSTGGSQIMLAVSRDGGRFWQLRLEQPPGSSVAETVLLDPLNTGVPPPGLGAVNPSHVAVGPGGDVYVSLYFVGGFSVYRSTDAGQSFIAPDFSGTRGLPFGPSSNVVPGSVNGLPIDHFRQETVRAIAADPSRPGSVYAAEAIGPVNAAGNALDPGDVNFSRSSDDGQTWQTTVQLGGQTASVLNDDNNGQVAHGLSEDVIAGQALPRMAVDARGDITLIWYDTRRDPAGHRLDVFATVSTDGGVTFSPNFRVTDLSFDPNQGRFTDATGQDDFYLGDYLGLALANGTAYASWTDTRDGKQDIEFTRFSLKPAPAALNDRLEPNDTAATATNLGRVIQSHLPKLAIPAGDEDWFRIQTSSSGNLTVSATQEEPGGRPRLELFDASGATVLATGTDVRNATNQVIGQQVVFPSPAGQTYLVRVLPGTGAVPGGPSHYALDVQSLTADLGNQAHGFLTSILAAGDNDYYRLVVPAAGSLEVHLTPAAAFVGQMHLELLDPASLKVLASGTGAMTQSASLAVENGQALLLHVASEAGGQGTFTLEFTNLDQFATPLNTNLLFPAGRGPSQEAVADLNGDGKPDLVVSDAQANTVSVLLNNGDGTFQAPRQYAVGAFSTPIAAASHVPNLGRAVAVADLTGKGGPPDIIVTNYASGDVSVLLNNGDGTFAPQRRFNATAGPFAMAVGDLTGNGIPDLVVVGSTAGPGKVAVLLGRGDGTFLPPLLFNSPLIDSNPVAAVQIAHLTPGGPADLILTDNLDPNTHVLLGNGDGTFRAGPRLPMLGPGLAVADLNGDGIPDVVAASEAQFVLSYALGNGDGTFQDVQQFNTGAGTFAMTVADFGSAVPNSDGTFSLGPPDGHPDLLVAASGESGPVLSGPPQVLFYPGQVDTHGYFNGFGDPIVLASPRTPIDIKTGDLTGDGSIDITVVEQAGIRVIYGKKPASPAVPGDPNLGTVVHVVEQTLTIVPGHEEEDFSLIVPTETAPGAGDEVLDFSGHFQALSGAGITMQLIDTGGNLLGSGERFRVRAPQGAHLTLRVFGQTDSQGNQGSGAYTLDIDVLPQAVSARALPLLPGATSAPGGPTASLVVTLQGDRLDPATAQNTANYTITWLGPDGIAGTADDQVIPISSVVYDPSTNVDISTGTVQPTAVKQTLTFLFTQPLPAGSYQIQIRPAVQTAAFNSDEAGLLTPASGFTGHPVVSLSGSVVTEGSQLLSTNLVQTAGQLGSFSVWQQGTPFFGQLHDDLGAILDAALTGSGDSPSITPQLINQMLSRLAPGLGTAGQRPARLVALWTDPVSLDLVDPSGNDVNYDLGSGQLNNNIDGSFVAVNGNVEAIVVAVPSLTGSAGFTLDVSDVPATARGGVVLLGADSDQTLALTDGLRSGTTTFTFGF